METENKESIEEAKKVIDEAKIRNEKECLDKVLLALKEHNCQFEIVMVSSVRGNTFDIKVISN